MVYLGQGRLEVAIARFRLGLECKPEMPDAWRALGDCLNLLGETQAAEQAYAQQIRYSPGDPRLVAAAKAVYENRLPEASDVCGSIFASSPGISSRFDCLPRWPLA